MANPAISAVPTDADVLAHGRDVFARPLPARRTGAVMILDEAGGLTGIFADDDPLRHAASRRRRPDRNKTLERTAGDS